MCGVKLLIFLGRTDVQGAVCARVRIRGSLNAHTALEVLILGVDGDAPYSHSADKKGASNVREGPGVSEPLRIHTKYLCPPPTLETARTTRLEYLAKENIRK